MPPVLGRTGERAIVHHGIERIADFRPAPQFAPLAFLGRDSNGVFLTR